MSKIYEVRVEKFDSTPKTYDMHVAQYAMKEGEQIGEWPANMGPTIFYSRCADSRSAVLGVIVKDIADRANDFGGITIVDHFSDA